MMTLASSTNASNENTPPDARRADAALKATASRVSWPASSAVAGAAAVLFVAWVWMIAHAVKHERIARRAERDEDLVAA